MSIQEAKKAGYKYVYLNGFTELISYAITLSNLEHVGEAKSHDGYNIYQCYETIEKSVLKGSAEINYHYYLEGYRESVLTIFYGEDYVWENFSIDVKRYSPDSARRVSYDKGWQCAVNDLNFKKGSKVLPR